MAIVVSATLVHISFGEREAFGSPYPTGLAVGHIDQVGDASGTRITASFSTELRNLYRLELYNCTRGESSDSKSELLTFHEWATGSSGFGANAFTLNWPIDPEVIDVVTVSTFSKHSPSAIDKASIRRFPMGRTDDFGVQNLIQHAITNVDTIVYDFDVVFSYWPVAARFLPGFLSSFWESPIAPSIVPIGRG